MNNFTTPKQPTTLHQVSCTECNDTGVVTTDVDDGEGHTMRGVGSKPCLCTKNTDIDEVEE